MKMYISHFYTNKTYSCYFLLLNRYLLYNDTIRHESNKDIFNTLLYEHIAIHNMILRLEKK